LGAAGATLGGTLAAGLSGPGRYRYGGVRDFILNVRLVDGLGQMVRGGGKVVKNAAGYDLPKLMAGSAGRLGVLVELTFKVFPSPPAYATLRRDYGDLSQALEAMTKLTRASLDIEAIELEPAQRSARLAVRLAGLADLLDARLDRLRSLMGDGEALLGPAESAHWEGLRQFQWVPADWSLVKVPVTPSLIPALDGALSTDDLKRHYSVAGNVAWIALPGRLAWLDTSLIEMGLDGIAVLGPARIRVPFLGTRRGTEFAVRVKRALDPLERFPEL
jgi:glycolate oxidase FAD binding subunit